MIRPYIAFFLCCAVLLLASVQAYSVDGSWNNFHLQDVNGPVKAMVRGPAGEIYVGGSFTEAGGVAAANIARWSNGTWSALGTGISGGTQPIVEALAITPNGTLYAGGLFTTAGGKTVNNITEWNGQIWQAIGNGANSRVTALTIGDNGALYAGGEFTTIGGKSASGIAQWFGGQWAPLGTGIQGGKLEINTLSFDSGILYTGGNFTSAGGVEVHNIAQWNGQNWQPIGDGIPEYTAEVHMIAAIDGKLYAAGLFALPGETTTANVRSWDGKGWSDHGYFNGPVYTIAAASGGIVAAGSFTKASTTASSSSLAPAANIAAASGSGWSPLSFGVDGPVYTLLYGENTLIAGGNFSLASGVVAHGIARWNGSNWARVGNTPSTSVNGTIHSAAFAPNGDLYVGGSFTTAGSTTANSIARWDGIRWHALGSGVDGTVQALAVDSKGNIYAGGDFSTAGGTSANAIARWNGVQWESLNTNASFTRIYALSVNEAGTLYAGGVFSSIGSTAANNVARWVGKEWRHMNSGVNGTVNAMAYRAGRLYIGGDFSATAGGTLNGIAEWDGNQWLPLKSGVDGLVLALAIAPNGKLYAGGDFTIAARGVTRIGMWDGSQWNPMDGGMNHDVSSIAVDSSGAIYAAGLFTMAGGESAAKITLWTGGQWNALAAGISGTPFALATPHTTVFVGGNFGMAGGIPAHNLATWTPCKLSPLIAASSPLFFCPGDSVELSVPGDYISYLWNTGATTPTITVKETGEYSATVVNSTGCSAVTPLADVRVNHMIVATSPDVALCPGDNVKLSASGGVSYLWSPAEGLSCTTCAAPSAQPTVSTLYTVQAMSSIGCTSTATIAVEVYPAPEIPSIERSGNNLFSPATAVAYQWLRNRLPIPDATNNNYTVEVGDFGWFSLRTTDNNGCNAVSDSLFIDLSTSVDETGGLASSLRISGSDRVYTVQCALPHPAPLALVVADLLGRTVLALQQPTAAQHAIPIDLRGVTPGVYVVHISTEDGRWTKTIVVR